jgi:two-component system response regulator
MNELWTNVSTRTREEGGLRYRSTVATDRLGFRKIFNGALPVEDFGSQRLDVGCATKHLVLVEDSDDDAFLFGLGVKRSGLDIETHRAKSLSEARGLLAGNRPSLVTLDCDLNGERGLDLLREIRTLESYRPVPVVMMSGSESSDDVRDAYTNGANSFLKKPFDCQRYVESVGALLEYWLEMNCPAPAAATLPSCAWAG